MTTAEKQALASALGAVIRDRRLAMGKTQAKVAKEAGVTQAALSNWEHGRDMQITSLVAVARALQQPADQLIFDAQFRRALNASEAAA